MNVTFFSILNVRIFMSGHLKMCFGHVTFLPQLSLEKRKINSCKVISTSS